MTRRTPSRCGLLPLLPLLAVAGGSEGDSDPSRSTAAHYPGPCRVLIYCSDSGYKPVTLEYDSHDRPRRLHFDESTSRRRELIEKWHFDEESLTITSQWRALHTWQGVTEVWRNEYHNGAPVVRHTAQPDEMFAGYTRLRSGHVDLDRALLALSTVAAPIAPLRQSSYGCYGHSMPDVYNPLPENPARAEAAAHAEPPASEPTAPRIQYIGSTQVLSDREGRTLRERRKDRGSALGGRLERVFHYDAAGNLISLVESAPSRNHLGVWVYFYACWDH